MSVYVDDLNAKFGNMFMCHMIADRHDELIAMVDRIGVQRKWIQHAGTPMEHFDICLEKKRLAIKAGAIAISRLELSHKIHLRNCKDPDCGMCRGFKRLMKWRDLSDPPVTASQIDLKL